jgi:acyl carrier protein
VLGEPPALILYYTSPLAADSQPALADALRTHLAAHLPDYMRPSLVQHLDAFPLNPNGKVDRKALPAPQARDAQVPPQGATEERVLALAHELLQRQDFGVTANFFEVGGHSLLAARLVTRLRAEFGIEFPLTALYSSPTVRACAAVVESALQDRLAAGMLEPAPAGEGDELLL